MMITQKVKKEMKPLDTRYLCYGVGRMGKKCVMGFKEHKQHRKQVESTNQTHVELFWNTITRIKHSENY